MIVIKKESQNGELQWHVTVHDQTQYVISEASAYHITKGMVLNKLNPLSKVLFGKPTVTQPVKKFPAFYRTQRFITMFMSPSLVPIVSQMHPVHTFPPYFPTIHSNIILPSTLRSSE